MTVPTSFPDVQAEIERFIRDGAVTDAERLVERLKEKALTAAHRG